MHTKKRKKRNKVFGLLLILLLLVNQTNRKEVMVRINDRGPFVKNRIIDLSYAAAQKIDLIGPGTAPVILQPIPTRLEPRTHRYFIQVGSFLSRSNARKSLASLGQTWKNSRIQEASVQGNRFWRVQIGAYAGLPEARRVRANLNRDYPGCFIVAD